MAVNLGRKGIIFLMSLGEKKPQKGGEKEKKEYVKQHFDLGILKSWRRQIIPSMRGIVGGVVLIVPAFTKVKRILNLKSIDTVFLNDFATWMKVKEEIVDEYDRE